MLFGTSCRVRVRVRSIHLGEVGWCHPGEPGQVDSRVKARRLAHPISTARFPSPNLHFIDVSA